MTWTALLLDTNDCKYLIKLIDRKNKIKFDFKKVFIPLFIGRFNSNSLQEAKGQKLLLGAALMKW